MPRAQSKIMSKEDKKAAVADMKDQVTEAVADLKGHKGALATAKKNLTAAKSAVKIAERAVTAGTKEVAKLKDKAAKLRAAK